MTAPSRSLKELFLAAVEVAPENRAAWVKHECGPDAELRDRLGLMLAAHDSPQSLFDRPGQVAPIAGLEDPKGVGPTTDPIAAESTGARIGPYKLLQQIGEGGMGTVWMAEQMQPVQRKVALKIVKAGMDTRQVLARFEAERQALALMEHANIAKVLDGGATDTGRPYFVMELVKGQPITKYCDEHRLLPKERLDLFLAVCQAIQHAHQKGIIHRDIKPSNILVAPYDGRPVVKVIDFGVVKAAGQRLTEKTLFTAFGAVIGTLEYMSPEQAELNNQDIDTRSDIYSLGVLLYELLTGTTPLIREHLQQAVFTDMLRVIREQDPPKPSTRLSESKATLASISAQRQMEPAKLTKLVRGELDWIVMKSLEKDRNRRYETANGLAQDIDRYLRNEAVAACPPSATYRLRKFYRRNRGPILAAALVFLALVGGIVGTTAGLMRAEQARKDAVAAREAEAEQRRIAEDERAVAKAVNEFLQQDLLQQANIYEQANRGFAADPNLSLKEALHRAATRIGDRFKDQPLTEAAIRQTIGKAYFGVGDYQLGVPHLERALMLRQAKLGPDDLLTLRSKNDLAGAYLNLERPAEALSPLEATARLRRERLGPAHPDTLDSMIGLAICYVMLNRLPDAVSLLEETLKLARANLGPDHHLTTFSMSKLAMVYRYGGRLPEAIALHEETLKLSKAKWGPRHPSTLLHMGLLAMAYQAAGRFAEAVSLHEEALKLMKEHLGPDNPQTITTMWALAKAYRGSGRQTEAVELVDEARKLSQARHGSRHLMTLLLMSLLAELHMDQGKHDLAEPLLRDCVAIFEKDWPDESQSFEAKSLLGGALLGQLKYSDAEPLLLAGYEGMKQREAKMPAEDRDLRLPEVLKWLAQLYDALDKPEEAAKWRKELEALQFQLMK